MERTSPRLRKISHWTGIVLAAPMFAMGLYLLYQYRNGGFGNEVTTKDTVAVIGFIFVSTAAIYVAMRFAGFLLTNAIQAFRNIGRGNGTSAGSGSSRPE